MNIIIVGASFAGRAAAVEAAKLYPEAAISLYDREEDLAYQPSALNQHLIEGQQVWQDQSPLLLQDLLAGPVRLHLGQELVGLDVQNQTARFRRAEEDIVVPYDYVILAMGAKQDLQLSCLADSDLLLEAKTVAQMKVSLAKLADWQELAIVGAGQLGLEGAVALARAGKVCHLFEASPYPLAKHFDADMVTELEAILAQLGVTCHFGQAVDSLTGSGKGVAIKTLSGTYEADGALLATNFRPNSQVVTAVLACRPDGTLLVDDYLRTSQPNVLAVGDLIQLPVAYFGASYLPTVQHALLTGRLAAHNLVENCLPLPLQHQGLVSQVGDQTLISLGLTQGQAGLWEEVLVGEAKQPGRRLKVVARRSDGLLLGLQLVGPEVAPDWSASLSLLFAGASTVTSCLGQGAFHSDHGEGGLPGLVRQALMAILRQGGGACD